MFLFAGAAGDRTATYDEKVKNLEGYIRWHAAPDSRILIRDRRNVARPPPAILRNTGSFIAAVHRKRSLMRAERSM